MNRSNWREHGYIWLFGAFTLGTLLATIGTNLVTGQDIRRYIAGDAIQAVALGGMAAGAAFVARKIKEK